ncbi:MAG: type IV pili methyl-accepting chemotaxis transducer N-terminal domain-containing protein [Betaproteobacteria bacterium]
MEGRILPDAGLSMPVSFARRSLSTKLVWIALTFLVVALGAIGFTLYESWQLEGGAAAINDMGSERMRSYRVGYLLSESLRDPRDAPALRRALIEEMDRWETIMEGMRRGDPVRPLFLPRTDRMQAEVESAEREWHQSLRPRIERILATPDAAGQHAEATVLRPQLEAFVQGIDRLVLEIEQSNARDTTLMRSMQLGLVALAIVGTVALVYLMFLLVVRPVLSLQDGMQRMARGELDTRLPIETRDEFGELADGFNRMASRLQELYSTLEERVADKTRDLAVRNRELGALYEMARMLNEPAPIEDLCRSFLRRLMMLHGAAGGAVRLVDAETRQLHLYAHEGLSVQFAKGERCIDMGHCFCGGAAAAGRSQVDAIESADPLAAAGCRMAGYRSVATIPIRVHRELLGVFNLFFTKAREVSVEDRQLLETLGHHLGAAIENQRLASRERELAVYEERSLLARELHDSIAQALAFLNIQVQMLEDSLRRNARAEVDEVVARIRDGVRESYDDVRELLTHFRVRVKQEEDIGVALRKMLARFGGQTRLQTQMSDMGTGLPLPPEIQLQVLHVLQEALSNVRKHAEARRVSLSVERGPVYRFVVGDDGRGFDAAGMSALPESHVGIRIMRERAQRIGAELEVRSSRGSGTTVTLTLPVVQTNHAARSEEAA